MMVAAILWSGTSRPDLLIADTGTLVGVMTERGRALSRDRGAGFVAGIWLENDGDRRDQAGAAALWPGGAPERKARIHLAGMEVTHLQGKRAAESFKGCQTPALVVSSVDLPDHPNCDIYDPKRLRKTGSVAVWLMPEGPRFETAAGTRLWHRADQDNWFEVRGWIVLASAWLARLAPQPPEQTVSRSGSARRDGPEP